MEESSNRYTSKALVVYAFVYGCIYIIALGSTYHWSCKSAEEDYKITDILLTIVSTCIVIASPLLHHFELQDYASANNGGWIKDIHLGITLIVGVQGVIGTILLCITRFEIGQILTSIEINPTVFIVLYICGSYWWILAHALIASSAAQSSE